MTKKEILKEWKASSGNKITEMLKKYWVIKKEEDIISTAREIFDVQN